MLPDRRRKILRGIALLLLFSVPWVLLAAAIFTREPDLVCGRWWYGTIIFEFVATYLLL